jgi:hypothetical protein
MKQKVNPANVVYAKQDSKGKSCRESEFMYPA